jgi:hypothetical protein
LFECGHERTLTPAEAKPQSSRDPAQHFRASGSNC